MSANQSSSPESFLNDQLQAIGLGSKRRSLLRQSSLAFCLLAGLSLAYLLYLKLVGDRLTAVLLVVLALATYILRRGIYSGFLNTLPGWAEFITRDSAYGVIQDDGISYRAPLRRRRVSGAQIYRLVYRLRERGRIDLYLFNRHSPIRFGPSLPADLEESLFIRLIEIRLKAAGVPLDLSEGSLQSAQPFYAWFGR